MSIYDKFKVGDRVRTTDFPTGVYAERGHQIGDTGTVVGSNGSPLVRFDRRQGLDQTDRNGITHKHVWVCDPRILEYTVDATPEAVAEAITNLEILVNGKKDFEREDGTFLSPSGAKAIIHVHQAKIKKGEPAVILRRRGKSRHFTKVEINGPSTMIHSQAPDSCGARVWIETKAEVVGYE